jgi:hypothetical protein
VVAPAGGQTSTDVSPNPSVNQYVESVPTAKGAKPSRYAPDHREGKLAPDLRRRLEQHGGADAEALEAIATEARLGAPTVRAGDGRGGSEPRRRGETPGAATPQPPRAEADKGFVPAVTGAVLETEGRGTLLLIVALVTVAVMVGGVAAARNRPRRA